jgi:hypothetical protein
VSQLNTPSIGRILDVHRAGIDAIADITGRFEDHDWQLPTPCDEWTACDLAGHVITVTTMWHEALDDASAGIATPRWRWTDMARHNTEYLAALPDESGPERIGHFVDLASKWCDRVAETDPDLPIPVAVQDVCPLPLTVATFAWLAGGEFHVHAWDFAQTIGADYGSPLHARSILDARSALWGVVSTHGDPWELVIRHSRA